MVTMTSDSIYADFAAATPTDPRVIAAMKPYFTEKFGNPSSVHSFGQATSQAIESVKKTIAQCIGCEPNELVFTSGGTESNNLAILGVARANKQKGQHIIVSAIEHPSILNACKSLEKDGFEVTYLPVGRDGLVKSDDLESAISPDTTLISIHLANSEIGVIQDISVLTKIAKKHNVYFHTDACQAVAYMDVNVNKLGVDLLTFNGSKLYGPKGVGCLVVRKSVDIFPIIFGGGQQNSLRSGTENVPGIVGLAKALVISVGTGRKKAKQIEKLRNWLQIELPKLKNISINVADSPRLPNHLSVIINGVEGNLVEKLNNFGLAISSGSACSSKTATDSHVLQSVGLTSEQINSTIRISLGRSTTKSDCQKIVDIFNYVVG